jgi:zinc transport system substrate-binding protein
MSSIKKRNKYGHILFLIILLLFNFAQSQTRYITTIHPFQEIIKGIIHNHAQITTMIPPGASPHNYEIRPSDMKVIESAAALLLGGPGLDTWARKFNNTKSIELLDLVPEEFLLHFDADLSQQNDIKTHHENHSTGIDPHFWTDPLAIKAMLPFLTDTLCAIDEQNCAHYKGNALRFAYYLDSLYLAMEKSLRDVKGRSVLLSHPFFRYYLHRFDIKIIGIIEDTPGTEPTPRELSDIIMRIKKENVRAILTHPQLSDLPAKLVSESTGIKVVELDHLGGRPGRLTYEEIMSYNTQILLEALR